MIQTSTCSRGRSSYYSNSDYNRLESDSTYDYEYDNEGNLYATHEATR